VINAQRFTTDLVGTVLEGAYCLTRLIGEGGMGVVYEAIQLRLNKRVAIKLLARDLATNQEVLARFHREAEITSHLGHPHLVTVIDFGTAETGEPYLVMEYLHGEDLDHRIHRVGRLPVPTAVYIIRQVASALGAAHGQGIVHRDLKPANVFLVQASDEPDFVKVLDFGISKMKMARTRLTRVSAVIGTPNYMSPEQATGMVEDIDHRADQWALACIAWEMLAGRTPFWAEDIGAIFYQIINLNPYPLTKVAPDLPPNLEPVLLRALAKNPNERFPSVREFARALETAVFGRPADVTPPPAFTPVPLLMSRGPNMDQTMGYDGKALVRPLAKPITGTIEILHVAEQSTSANLVASLGQSTTDMTAPFQRKRSQILYAIVGTLGIIIIIAGIFLLRSSDQPSHAESRKLPGAEKKMPMVRPLPASMPAAATASLPSPLPATAQASPPRPAKSKRVGKSNPQGVANEASDPFESASDKPVNWPHQRRANPFADPFENGEPRMPTKVRKKENPY
jgi:serine/threonine protein kinase